MFGILPEEQSKSVKGVNGKRVKKTTVFGRCKGEIMDQVNNRKNKIKQMLIKIVLVKKLKRKTLKFINTLIVHFYLNF